MVWVYVVLVFQPFEALFFIPGLIPTTVFPAFAVVVLVVTPSDRLARIPVSLLLGAMVGWLAVSRQWSAEPGLTMYLIRSQLVPLVLVAAVVGTMSARRTARTVLAVVVVTGLWSLVMSLLVGTSRSTVIDGAEVLGFRGTFVHKNILGVFMVCGLCAVLAFASGKGRRWAIALCVLLIVGTRSATTAGGLLAVLFVWGWMAAIRRQRSGRERQFMLVASFSSALAALLIVLGLMPTLLNLYDKDVTFSGRTEIWAASAETIREAPLKGYGLGGVWMNQESPITLNLQARIGFPAAHTHNGALELLLEGGVVNLALTAFFLIETLRLALACLRRDDTAAYGQWGALTVVALFFMGLAEPLFEGPHLGLLVIVWVCMARARNDARRRGEPGARGTIL